MSFGGVGGSGKCFACKKDMFSKPIRVDNKDYHPNCFICIICQKKLTLDSYKRNKDQIYCEHDYKVHALKSVTG